MYCSDTKINRSFRGLEFICCFCLTPCLNVKIWARTFLPPPPLLFSYLCSLVAGDGEKDVPPHCNLQVYTYTCDVGKRENVYLTAERVRKEVGEVSVLVNNAGVVSGHHLLECPDELIERTMMVNCHAHFWVTINSFLLPFLVINFGKWSAIVELLSPWGLHLFFFACRITALGISCFELTVLFNSNAGIKIVNK